MPRVQGHQQPTLAQIITTLNSTSAELLLLPNDRLNASVVFTTVAYVRYLLVLLRSCCGFLQDCLIHSAPFMAEALAVLGLVSSIVQLVDFGSRVLARLKQFQTDSHDLSDTLQSIKVRLPLILDAVKRTREQAGNGFVTESTAQALTPVIGGCEQGS